MLKKNSVVFVNKTFDIVPCAFEVFGKIYELLLSLLT